MKNKIHVPSVREILQKIILPVSLVLLCMLFTAVAAIWFLTDYLLRKLEREV